MKYTNNYTNRVAEFEAQQKQYLNSAPQIPTFDENGHLIGKPKVSEQAIKDGVPATLDKRFIKNPYELAREKILLDMVTSRRNEILAMEKRGDTNNARYNEFIERVAKLGDSLSNS